VVVVKTGTRLNLDSGDYILIQIFGDRRPMIRSIGNKRHQTPLEDRRPWFFLGARYLRMTKLLRFNWT
jgi:hypothetical protein